jgi:hypothetical protein
MHNPWVAIAAAGLAAWIFGAVYYGVLGKVWMRAQGINPDDCKDKKMPLAPMVTSFAAALVMSYVLQHLLVLLEVTTWQHAIAWALTIGIGFVVTSQLVNNMFQQRTLKLTAIDSGHWLGGLAIEAVILTLLA